jgi:hypothetical protein
MTRSRVAETVTGQTMAELVAARDRAQADMVELRVDYVRDIDVAQALAGRRLPVIFTCRAKVDGSKAAKKSGCGFWRRRFAAARNMSTSSGKPIGDRCRHPSTAKSCFRITTSAARPRIFATE